MGVRVAAVIITYNRLALLQEGIAAVCSQTRLPEAIIVINNGSTDGTGEWLATQPGLVVYNQENLGGAGGFNRGIKEAAEANFDWVWVMDDDGYPALNCLAELMNATLTRPNVDAWGCIVLDRDNYNQLAFECPQVLTTNGTINYDITFIENWAPFFNGILLSKSIIEKTGYPNPALFIWGDEVDYYQRIINCGGLIQSTTKAVFYHPKDRLYDVKYNGEYVYDGPLNWKLYCFFRNRAYLGRKYYSSTRTLILLTQFSYFYHKLSFKDYFKAVTLVLKAHWDGLTYNLKRKLPY
jgi:rhamnopyranosyl-N-acetylglucosaminyl-diphospho-decaprenol beta-1,3/1,4-galactofuranosyltransferase